jgi:hypothetical protein
MGDALMKNFFRSTALMGLLLLFGPLGAPAQDCFTELWVQADQTSIHGNSMAYDPVTGSLLLPQISSPTGPVYVLDAADGTLTTKTLSTKGISFGSPGCFAIGADEGGRIYGLSDFGSRSMILWDGVDDDTPTSVPLEQGRLARNYDVHGGANGEPTTIYATGSADYGPIEVFTCERAEFPSCAKPSAAARPRPAQGGSRLAHGLSGGCRLRVRRGRHRLQRHSYLDARRG